MSKKKEPVVPKRVVRPYKKFVKDKLARKDYMAWTNDDEIVKTPSKKVEESFGSYKGPHVMGSHVSLPTKEEVDKHHEEFRRLTKRRPGRGEEKRSEKEHELLSGKTTDALRRYKESTYNTINGHLRRNGGIGPVERVPSEHDDDYDKEMYADDHKRARELVKHIDQATTNRIKDHKVVYRGLGKSYSAPDKFKVGDIFHDHAYVSASHDEGIARGFVSGTEDPNNKDITSHPDVKDYNHWWDMNHFDKERIRSEYNKTTHNVTHHHIARIVCPPGTKGHYLDNKTAKSHYDHSNGSEDEFLIHRGTKFRVTGHTSHIIQHSKADSWSPANTNVLHITHMVVHHQPDHKDEE